MPDEELLTLQEVARQTRMSEKTIRRWIKSGQLPAIELGGRYRISPTDLKRFLDEHRKHPPEHPTEE